MQIYVHLLGILRDQIPEEANGKLTVTLASGATMETLLAHFEFKRPVAVAINETVDPQADHPLHDGDKVSIFTVIGGGQPQTQRS